MSKMTAATFVAKAINIAKNYKTLYVMGCFGAPMNAKNKKRYTQNNAYNKQPARTAMINAASADTFGFDCVCLIKGILWGWTGDPSKVYGGATYASNGVPDISADQMIKMCDGGGSTNFAGIVPGEMLWKEGHAGIYIGDGLAVECTPAWANKVQITAVGNLGTVQGYNTRQWTKHGKLPYVDYTAQPQPEPAPPIYEHHPFTDVPDGRWFSEDVQWAWENGLVDGIKPDKFYPDNPCTRAQMCTMLRRFAGTFGLGEK